MRPRWTHRPAKGPPLTQWRVGVHVKCIMVAVNFFGNLTFDTCNFLEQLIYLVTLYLINYFSCRLLSYFTCLFFWNVALFFLLFCRKAKGSRGQGSNKKEADISTVKLKTATKMVNQKKLLLAMFNDVAEKTKARQMKPWHLLDSQVPVKIKHWFDWLIDWLFIWWTFDEFLSSFGWQGGIIHIFLISICVDHIQWNYSYSDWLNTGGPMTQLWFSFSLLCYHSSTYMWGLCKGVASAVACSDVQHLIGQP